MIEKNTKEENYN